MNTYIVSQLGKQCTVQADDFTLSDGVIIFRDRIGRAIEVFGISPNLRVTCEYPDDPIFDLRLSLADQEREEQLETLTAVLASKSYNGPLG